MSLAGRLASQSAVIFAARLFGAGLTFLAQAAIARVLGSAALGEYLLITAAVNIIAVVMPLGFETTGTYFAAEYRARGEGRLLRGFLMRAYGHVGGMAILLLLAGYPVAAHFGEAGRVLMANWLPAAILALATATIYVNSALLVGLKRAYAGFFAEAIFRPMAIVAAFLVGLVATGAEARLGVLVWALSGLYALIAAVHLGFVIRAVRQVPIEVAPRRAEWRRWWRFAVPWVAITLATDFFFDIDLLLLSNLLGREDLAIFGVCTRVFSLISFGVAAVYAVTMPDMFESEARADRDGFHRRVGDANLVASGLAVALFLAVAIAGPIALMLFGPAFAAGAAPLAVLSLSLVVRAVLGPATLVLSVHDRPWSTLPAIGIGMLSLILGNLLLVPRMGLMGASLAALVAIALWSGALWVTVLRQAGVDVSLFARLRRSSVSPAPAE